MSLLRGEFGLARVETYCCGLCSLTFDLPIAKAQHLREVHRAYVRALPGGGYRYVVETDRPTVLSWLDRRGRRYDWSLR